MKAAQSRLCFAWLFLLAGCGSVPLESAPPDDYHLTGRWVLENSSSEAIETRGTSFRSGFLIQDFPLLVTRTMRIEQDARSMGIEYDEGTYRDVTWGERRRGIWEVRAGWYQGELHIYSKAPDTSGVEIWRLKEDGRLLVIDIEVKDEQTRHFQRSFRRSPAI